MSQPFHHIRLFYFLTINKKTMITNDKRAFFRKTMNDLIEDNGLISEGALDQAVSWMYINLEPNDVFEPNEIIDNMKASIQVLLPNH